MEVFDRLPKALRDALNSAEFGFFAGDFAVGKGRGTTASQIHRLRALEAEMKRRFPVAAALAGSPDPA